MGTPVTIFSVYCHLASASGAWWQKLRNWGGASSLGPSGSLTQTQSHKHLQDCYCKTSIFSSPVLLLCVHTLNNPFAHPSCSYYYLFSPSILFFAHLIVLHFLFYCTFYSYFSFLPYICSCVVLLLYYFYFYSFALSTERTWFDLHFTSDYTQYNLLCDK